VPRANDCAGAPSIVQSRYDPYGNLEMAYPGTDGRIKFRFAPLWSRACDWAAEPIPWDDRAISFGDPSITVHSVRLIQSTFGNLELIASGTSRGGATVIQHWFRHDWPTDGWPNASLGNQWTWIPGALLSGTARVVERSTPAFFQSRFRTTVDHGNFEVFAPSRDGGFLHWFYDHGNRDRGWQTAPSVARGTDVLRAVHVMQADFGRNGNFEAIGETGDASGVGFGRLLFYWGNNDSARTSADAVWSLPSVVLS